MATLKICIHKVAEGCQAIKTYNPFPCDLTIDAENAPKSNPKCWDIVNGAIVAIKGFKQILAILRDVFTQIAPAGLSQDEVELIMNHER